MKQILYELNEKAMEFYHKILYRSYNTALRYLCERHLTLGTINDLMIGYANDDYYNLYDYLKAGGYTDDVILSSGLVVKDEEGNYIHRYNNRIIFPIKDEDNKVVAFGARVLDDSKPKYINSPENIIYSKGRNLYGINIAKDYAQDGLILVEGYIDFVTMYQAGFKNVAALLGNATATAQAELIKKYTNKVILLLDSDMAGQCAAERAIEKFKAYDIKYTNIKLEGAKDVDEFINKYGAEKIKETLKG